MRAPHKSPIYRRVELQQIVVTAQQLNEARSSIETQTGASTYVISSDAIAATPGGENVQLNQVLLQAPDVVQDSLASCTCAAIIMTCSTGSTVSFSRKASASSARP